MLKQSNFNPLHKCQTEPSPLEIKAITSELKLIAEGGRMNKVNFNAC